MKTLLDYNVSLGGYCYRVTGNDQIANIQEKTPGSGRFKTKLQISRSEFDALAEKLDLFSVYNRNPKKLADLIVEFAPPAKVEKAENQEVQIREVQVNYGKPKKVYNVFRSASDVVEFLREIAPNNSQEHLIAVYLDGGHKPIAYSVVCTGLATSCPVHPREVYQRAILCGAYSVVLAHNHPSGDLRPSPEDQKVTAQMKAAAETLGLKLLDHVIFADTGHYSFQSEGKL